MNKKLNKNRFFQKVVACKAATLLTLTDQSASNQTPSQLHSLIACVFAFSFVWALAGNLNEAEMEKFETFARNQLDEIIGVKASCDVVPHLLIRMLRVSFHCD